jgi:hypothetical protein
MIYSIIDNSGNIIDRVVADSSWENMFPDTTAIQETDITYAIGGTLVNGVYTPPKVDEIQKGPITVTPRQARLALLAAGLLDQVQSAVDQAGGATKITWEYATEISRDDPMIEVVGQSLNLTSQQIDNLFTQASAL